MKLQMLTRIPGWPMMDNLAAIHKGGKTTTTITMTLA